MHVLSRIYRGDTEYVRVQTYIQTNSTRLSGARSCSPQRKKKITNSQSRPPNYNNKNILIFRQEIVTPDIRWTKIIFITTNKR